MEKMQSLVFSSSSFVYAAQQARHLASFYPQKYLFFMIHGNALSPSLRTIEWNIIPFLVSIFLIFPFLLGSKVNASCLIKLFHK